MLSFANPRETRTSNTGAKLGFEAQLWEAADAPRSKLNVAEYKHAVLPSPPLNAITRTIFQDAQVRPGG